MKVSKYLDTHKVNTNMSKVKMLNKLYSKGIYNIALGSTTEKKALRILSSNTECIVCGNAMLPVHLTDGRMILFCTKDNVAMPKEV